MIHLVLCGHAAHRTQLFLYLESCWDEELGPFDLCARMDEHAAA